MAAKPKNNVDKAVTLLRDMIFSGTLLPGSDHLETELAEQLAMSRTPVREACVQLAAQGLLEVRPRRGVRILPISAKDMEEIYDVLTVLEALAAARAAQAGYDASDLATLEASIVDMETALAKEDRTAWANADDRFHAELVRLGGNGRVITIVGLMADQVRRARTLTLQMRPLPTQSNSDHRQVLEAIRAGDHARAQAVHRSHRMQAKSILLDLLKKSHLRQL
ncbi:MAG: GntR family transcriptional regulator [Pseudomonadota bacterium]